MGSKDNNLKFDLDLTDDERQELAEHVDRVDGKTDLTDDEDSAEALGIGRKRYQITCHKKTPDGKEVSWVEKTYGSALAHVIGAAGCQLKVGDPSHALRNL